MLKNDTEAAADQRIPFRSRAEGDQGKHENPALLCYRSLGEAERVWKIGYYCSAWALIGRGADAAVWCQRRLICTLHRFPTNLTWYRHQRLRRLISSGWVKKNRMRCRYLFRFVLMWFMGGGKSTTFVCILFGILFSAFASSQPKLWNPGNTSALLYFFHS